jgi:cell division transport system ATP-binding protein
VIAGTGERETGKRVRAALDQVGLLARSATAADQLSTGEQQRVGIARAVVGRPPLLIADEPTGNLDPALSLEIMYLFARLNRVGVTVLVASHDLALLERLGHRRIALGDGRLIEDRDHAFPSAPA